MIENCEYHPDVIDAMFRQQTESTTVPYKKHTIPGTIHASDFDMGRHDIAYHDMDYMNNGSGNSQWNNGWTYRNDGTDIEDCKDTSSLSSGHNVAWVNDGEWMLYTVNVTEPGAYRVTFRIADSSGAGRFHLEVNGKNITGEVTSKATTGNQDWTDVTVENVILEKGVQKIKLFADKGGFNINYFRFSEPGSIGSLPMKVLNGYASETGSSLYLAVNKPFDKTVAPDVQNFRLKVNSFIETISGISYDAQDKSKLILSLKKKLNGAMRSC